MGSLQAHQIPKVCNVIVQEGAGCAVRFGADRGGGEGRGGGEVTWFVLMRTGEGERAGEGKGHVG